MKKILLLLVMVFLLTGCGAEYTLIYENGIFREELSIPKDKLDEEEFSDALEFIGREEKKVNYTQEDTKDKKIIKQKLGEKFTTTDIIEYCYNHIYVLNDKKVISISTDKNNYCSDKNIVIKLKTDKEVLSSNANKVEGNTYIWTDFSDGIDVQISKDRERTENNSIKSNILIRIIIVGIFLVILIPIVIFVKKKNRE